MVCFSVFAGIYIAVILRKDGIFLKFVETKNHNVDVGGLLEM